MSTQNVNENVLPRINRLQMMGLVAGVVGLIGLAVGYVTTPARFWTSYHVAFLFWNNLSVGLLGALMLHHMVGGNWGFVNRRVMEAGAMTVIVMAVLFLPYVISPLHGMETLFKWTHESDAVIEQKRPYLNTGFFFVRMAIYFAFWIATAFILNAWSKENDRTGSPSFRTKARILSGPGILVYVLLFTFYIVDLVMSLDPHWMSTLLGLLILSGSGLSAWAFMTIMMRYLREAEPLQLVFTRERFHDLGNLMLAFTMLWAYMSFSQYLIGWSGNLPEEALWYTHRLTHGLQAVALILVIFHFFVPFFVLLQRRVKKSFNGIAILAAFIILMRHVDLWWLVKPNFTGTPGADFWWTDIAATVGIGGIWIAAFAFFLKSKNFLPVWESHHDRLPTKYEVYSHG
jgi:hypothetical protein